MGDEQTSLEEHLAEAEQALRDERAERDAAQRRAVELSSRVDLWRSRAEERSDRIRRLEAERDALRTPQGWVRARIGRTRKPQSAAGGLAGVPVLAARAEVRRPLLPVVRAAALGGGGPMRLLLAESDASDLIEEPSALADSDVVVVDTESTRRAPEVVARLLDWVGLPARQPLILVWREKGSVHDDAHEALAAAAEVVLSDSPAARDRWGDRVRRLPVTFDPSADKPAGRSFDAMGGLSGVEEGAYVRWTDGSGTSVAVGGPESWPRDAPDWLVPLAARGTPILGETPVAIGGSELSRLGTAARRWAYRDHDPGVVWERLLTSVGLSVPPVRPTVAGLLVSKRPEDLPEAIAGFRAQQYPRKELVVGCHGFPATEVGAALVGASALPVNVIEFDSSVPLGRCLNEAAASTGAAVLAKIDDDDYYGPGYLEDAVQALRYSGSRIVGKATQFTYREDEDVTVLRRGGSEETAIEGSVTGASLVFARSLWERVRFPHRPRRVDALFLRGARQIGDGVYANSRWDFVYRRRSSGHTWEVTPDAFAPEAVPAWAGWHPERSRA